MQICTDSLIRNLRLWSIIPNVSSELVITTKADTLK